MTDDRQYFAQRAQEETELAEAATDPAVAECHRELARKYREKASVGERPMMLRDPIG